MNVRRTHRYDLAVSWTGNHGSGTSGYRDYGRDHDISADGRPVIEGSSGPVFRGDKTRWNPELELVAALSQCHRREIAARQDVSIPAVSNWAASYPDFPEPVLGKTTHVPYYWWPIVRIYLDLKQLPRSRQSPAAAGARERDAKILEALALFPGGLTTEDVAALSGEQDEGTTANAVEVRYDGRLHRLDEAGVVSRTQRQGDWRNVWGGSCPQPEGRRSQLFPRDSVSPLSRRSEHLRPSPAGRAGAALRHLRAPDERRSDHGGLRE